MILSLFLCFLAASNAQEEQKPYTKVLDIIPADEDQYRFLVRLSNDADMDFWRGPSRVGFSSHVMIPPHRQKDVEEMLSTRGIQFTPLINDVQAQIDEESSTMESNAKQNNRIKRDNPMSFFLDYRPLLEINNYIKRLREQYSNISTIKVIGKTYKNQKLKVIKIGSEKEGAKPVIWIDACIHAREWISASTALYIIHQRVTQYDCEENVRKLVDNYDWYILPIANPDGYHYSHTVQRLWRKNLSPIPGSQYFGVDLNRNFDYMWNKSFADKPRNPNSLCYQGPHAFSEAESTAISKFLSARKEHLKFYFTLHSYGPYWVTPYGIWPNAAENFDELENLAKIGNTAMASYNGTTMPITPAFTLYSATGLSTDWVYAKLNVSYTYTLELGTKEHKFEPPKEKIIDIGEEVWRAIKAMSLHLLGK